ncbi:hypothetical protein Y032_0862g2746 [Ancylostoma ceylanicum]|uniref:Uncharacterized protein n=1 Tax=Ancylostoma ceylanicum TaxID=53326 RepID=A0A016WCK3_9BILA|nr:hypothetical protein Y032_0862g2746 [Ancylostoma ceylanicum]
MTDANGRFASAEPQRRTRTNAPQPPGHSVEGERTRRSRWATAAHADERAATAGPQRRTRTNAARPPGHSGGREQTRRDRRGQLRGIVLGE